MALKNTHARTHTRTHARTHAHTHARAQRVDENFCGGQSATAAAAAKMVFKSRYNDQRLCIRTVKYTRHRCLELSLMANIFTGSQTKTEGCASAYLFSACKLFLKLTPEFYLVYNNNFIYKNIRLWNKERNDSR